VATNVELARGSFDAFRAVDEDRVVAFGHARIAREPDPLKFEVGLLYTFADGKITELEGYTDHQQVREAAGITD
jgi:ketosteroid isomerase-like protein